jgi:hypothetical protein
MRVNGLGRLRNRIAVLRSWSRISSPEIFLRSPVVFTIFPQEAKIHESAEKLG